MTTTTKSKMSVVLDDLSSSTGWSRDECKKFVDRIDSASKEIRNVKDIEEQSSELIEDLTYRLLNKMGCEKDVAEGVIKGLNRTHRTLQQSFGRLLVEIIKFYAEQHKERRFDLRNEAICELCAHFLKSAEDDGIYLPYI